MRPPAVLRVARNPDIIGHRNGNAPVSLSQRECNMCHPESFTERPLVLLRALLMLLALTAALGGAPLLAQEHPLEGTWIHNEALSDDPDLAVETAIKAAGGKVERRWFGKPEKGRYRGGPVEHELYDRLSYDETLRIALKDPEVWMGYDDGFERIFHTDGRTQSVGASQHYESGSRDFSLGDWEGEVLVVEGRPRDGGFTMETYTLEEGGARLRVDLEIRPRSFGATIRMVRVYDRQ